MSVVWGCRLTITAQDVLTAFGEMRHDVIAKSLLSRGVSFSLTGLLLQELVGVHAVLQVPEAGTTAPFQFLEGGQQGGVMTPHEWNAMLDYALGPLIRSWSRRGMGFKLDKLLVSHAIWADHIIFV